VERPTFPREVVEEILDVHDAVQGFCEHTLDELPLPGDPWVELAPVAATTRGAFEQAVETMRIGRVTLNQLDDVSVPSDLAGELITIARTLYRQIHLLSQLFVDQYNEAQQRYLGLARSLEQHAIFYDDATATSLGEGAPF
jgi:hypothetical protein